MPRFSSAPPWAQKTAPVSCYGNWGGSIALFVLFQALTQLLAGVLDCSLSGCQNYRAFGFTIFRYLKSFQLTFTTFCLFSPSWGIKDTSNIFIGSIQYQSYLRLNDHLIQIMQPCWYLAIIFYPQNVDSNTVKMVFNLKSIFWCQLFCCCVTQRICAFICHSKNCIMFWWIICGDFQKSSDVWIT